MGLMSILKRLFGPTPQRAPEQHAEGHPKFNHPILGTVYLEDEDGDYSIWLTEEVTFHSYQDQIGVALEGDLSRPSEESIKAFEWIHDNWESVFRLIESKAFGDYYQPYQQNLPDVPLFESPNMLWQTEQLISLCCRDKNHFDFTLQFDWQKAQDDHVITFYVEDGECISHSVDG